MNAGMTFGQLKSSETIPDGSIFPISMGDGTGSRKVTKETLVKETGNALKIGDLEDLNTENKANLVAAINEAAQSGGGGASVDILDTPEEIEANTEQGKIAGALAMKEMFTELNDNLGGNILTYNESEDAYYIQHGADSVPKKLGEGNNIGVLASFSATLTPSSSSTSKSGSYAFAINGATEITYSTTKPGNSGGVKLEITLGDNLRQNSLKLPNITSAESLTQQIEANKYDWGFITYSAAHSGNSSHGQNATHTMTILCK